MGRRIWNGTTFKMNAKARKQLIKGYTMYYLKGEMKITLKTAYMHTLAAFFSVDYETRNGVIAPLLPLPGEAPSFGQFLYHCHKPGTVRKTNSNRPSPTGGQTSSSQDNIICEGTSKN